MSGVSKNIGMLCKIFKMSGNVRQCQEISEDIGGCLGMLKYVEKCLELFENVGKFREMSIDVERCWEMSVAESLLKNS